MKTLARTVAALALLTITAPNRTGQKIVVEEEYAASWMQIDNGYTNPASGAYRVGVLFQMGQFFNYSNYSGHGHTKDPAFTFESVKITLDDATVIPFNEGTFTWINVYPDSEPSPVTVNQAAYLYPSQRVESVGAMLEQIVHRFPRNGMEHPALWGPYHEIRTIPQSELRRRSLHAFLEPTCMMTYWQGGDGYDLASRKITSGSSAGHYSCEFTLLNHCTVEVWNEEVLVATYDNAAEIRILSPSDLSHGEVHSPPVGWAVGTP